MKYVIFKTESNGAALYEPIIIPEHVTHSTVKIVKDEGVRTPVNKQPKVFSAGFFYIENGIVKIDETRISVSLKIGPQPETDKAIITATFLNSGTSFFIEYL